VTRAFFAAWLFCAGSACVLSAQKPPEPPEEDESLAPKVYALNPVQARKEIVAGDYYFKKPNYSAAAKRYLEATRWDPGSAEAFRKLGESRERLHEYGPAREAYLKFLELGEDAREKDAVRKKIDKLPDPAAAKTKK